LHNLLFCLKFFGRISLSFIEWWE